MKRNTSDSQDAFSILSFCDAHDISRSMFYVLLRTNEAPAIMKVGRRTLISREAAADWRKRKTTDSEKKSG